MEQDVTLIFIGIIVWILILLATVVITKFGLKKLCLGFLTVLVYFSITHGIQTNRYQFIEKKDHKSCLIFDTSTGKFYSVDNNSWTWLDILP